MSVLSNWLTKEIFVHAEYLVLTVEENLLKFTN